jgi:primosomal protein N' (replication factor Y)
MRTTLFVNVLLPLPVAGYFTYRVPFELNESVAVGKRVVVQFGQKKIYTALIREITETPSRVQPKYILSVLDVQPVVNEIQFTFWEWMATYYCCTPGEVMNAALPSALKLASESKIMLNRDAVIDPDTLREKEYMLVTALQECGSMTLSEASHTIEQARIIPVIHTMIEKGLIVTEEQLQERYKPKTEWYVSLGESYNSEEQLQKAYEDLQKRAEKQLELLIEYIHLSQCLTAEPRPVSKTELLKRFPQGSPQLKALEKKGILKVEEKQVSRLWDPQMKTGNEAITLNGQQEEALAQIRKEFIDKNVVLLHGVTSSGKTELYINLIRETIEQGRQVLYLLPEIALTTQIINRLRKYFGPRVGVYHSRYDENERVEIWKNVAREAEAEDELLTKTAEQIAKYDIILGARSSLFLPYSNLGLIIVDEEHDPSYKQFEPAPRYNARDSAIYLASLHNANVLLGSATPSIETYYNATTGKYGLAKLPERYGNLLMPEIQLVDLKEEHRNKRMKSIFSETLLEGVQQALDNKEQVILFQNRRGFSLYLDCSSCHWTPHCVNCDVSLVYHKKQNMLRCHYCGFSTQVPSQCPECGHTGMMMKGFGTEKIEEELAVFFPQANIVRMDLDSTRSKHSYQKIISDFEEQRIDILVGTQMVTKGLDFDNVSLVGILNADNLLSYPDFRAAERGFQLMAQVSGRSGRKNKQGKVLIQAYNVSNHILRFVLSHDYISMYKSQLIERKRFTYPPFCRLIIITVKHPNADRTNKAASELAKLLRQSFGKRILGPEYPLVSRIRNFYLKNIMLKLEKGISLSLAKEEMVKAIKSLAANPEFSGVRIIPDIDPS